MQGALHRYRSADGLSLAYRVYGDRNARTPVLCLPGLTRNSRDFDAIARHVARSRFVICPDLRGRGFSDHDPNPQNYVPPTYVADVIRLLDELEIPRVVVLGTSLGGLMAMLIAALHPNRIAAAILNDVGPEVDPKGLARIREYTGRLPAVSNWPEAIAQAKAVYGHALPDLDERRWRQWAQASYRQDERGVPVLDMDPKIGNAVRATVGTPADPWPLWNAMANVPTLVLRGERSDILSAATVARMQREKSDLISVTVANRGHVPLLDEPESVAAIDRLLDAVE